MSMIINISRRDFLKTGTLIGGGLILGVFPHFGKGSGNAATPFAPNAFIRIGQDDMITIIVNKSEMGHGVYTSLPMVVAEELEADWSKISIEPAPVDPAYNHTVWGGVQGTGGSTSTWSTWDQLRKAGAAARAMLINAAAETWGVEPSACKTENGFIIHPESNRKLSFGTLAEKASQMSVPQEAPLKKPDEYRIIGTRVKRLDTPGKVSGKAMFGIDVKMLGMLTAVLARCPVFGGKLKSFNNSKTKANG